jgi:hypothetical protein
MSRRTAPSLLAICGSAAVALLCGCGGSSTHADCASAKAAAARYSHEVEVLNGTFTNKPAVNRVLGASGSLRASVRKLAGVEGGESKSHLLSFDAALAQQELVLRYILAGNFRAAAAHAAGLNEAVPAGLRNVGQICK